MPFSPSDIASLVVWLRADDVTGSDTDPVDTWPDRGGGGHDFTQSTAGAKPLLRTNVVGALPGIQFDGTDDFLDGGDLQSLFASAASYFVVYEPSDGRYQVLRNNGNDGYWRYDGDGDGYLADFRTARVPNYPSSMPSTGRHSLGLKSSASTYQAYKDGTPASAQSASFDNGEAYFYIGGSPSDPQSQHRWLNGYVFEVILFDAALSDSDFTDLENYAEAFWSYGSFRAGSFAIGGIGAVAATGKKQAKGAVTVAGIGTVTIAGERVTYDRTGSFSLSAVGATSVLGTKHATAVFTITAIGSFGGTGREHEVFAAWSVDIQGPNGGANLVTDAAFKSAKLTWTVEGPWAFEVDLRVADLSTFWMPGTHRVVFNGPFPLAGYITRLTRTGKPADLLYKASGLGLSSILDWRIVRHATTLNDEASAIVEWLLDEAQTQYNGDMGFAMGTVEGTTTTRTRNYCFGVVIGDAIRELASVGRGFDWEIDADGLLNIWNRSRGFDTGLSLAEGDTQSWDVAFDTSELLTTVSAIGDPSQPFGPIHDMVRHVGDAITFGRHEVAIDVDTTDRDELLDAAHAELAAGGGAKLTLHTMWLSDRGPWNLGDVWLQDTVTAVLPDFFGGDQEMRCIDVSVTLDPMPPVGGGAALTFIEHTFDALVSEADFADDDPDEAS